MPMMDPSMLMNQGQGGDQSNTLDPNNVNLNNNNNMSNNMNSNMTNFPGNPNNNYQNPNLSNK